MVKLPDYAWIGSVGRCAMRRDGKRHYYRDGGAWGTDVKIVGDKIITCGHSGTFKYLNNMEVIPCTKYEWWKDNGSGQYTGHVHTARVKALRATRPDIQEHEREKRRQASWD